MTLKIDDTFEQETAALQQDEKDRLLLAVVRYQMDGSEIDLPGNERFLWPVFRLRIDQDRTARQAKANAGRLGGLANGKRTESEEKQTEANESKPKQTEANENGDPAEKESTPEPLKEKEREKGTLPPQGPRGAKQADALAEGLFDRFWAAYPRKENKKNAHKAFFRLRPNEQLLDRMLSAIQRQRASPQWQEAGGKYIPHPSAWLNGERWEDQPQGACTGRLVSAQMYAQRDYTEEELAGSTVGDMLAEIKAGRA